MGRPDPLRSPASPGGRSARTCAGRHAGQLEADAEAEAWAAGIAGPAYGVDDQTAFKVSDGEMEIVSEGQWKQLK